MRLKLSGDRLIENFVDPYIIVEVNSSHFGDQVLAKEMIQAIKSAGADCVKFQSWSEESLYSKTYYEKNPIAKRFVSKFSLSAESILDLSNYARQIGLDFSSTPYSVSEAIFLVEMCKAPFIKIASMELNNIEFLKQIAELKTPLILSTGMGSFEEIDRAVQVITSINKDLTVLHCNSIYPTSFQDVNLNNIHMLREKFPTVAIGFSDHTLGIEASIAATAMGAAVLEKHFTLDRSRVGMDNQMAIEANELNDLVTSVRNVNLALGINARILTGAELDQRKNMRRSIVTARPISSGQIICREDLTFKRPGDGFQIEDLSLVIGKRLLRDLPQDVLILPSDVDTC
jgi:N-acetylneuraminate synthase